MKLVIKLGGTLLDDVDTRVSLARQLAEVSRESELVVVHGGGKQVTNFLEQRGVQSRFVNGLRVSDGTVIDAVTKVIAGGVNKQLVAAIIAAGESAVGLSGVDGVLTKAEPLHPDLQFVGKPLKTDPQLLQILVNAGYLPIIACIAGDGSGQILNVNADQMAVSCAAGWSAQKLLFLTDVDGVKDANGRLLPTLKPCEVTSLIAKGIASGGMQAKLEAALTGLQAGISDVIVAPGREPNICSRLLSGEQLGTRISLT